MQLSSRSSKPFLGMALALLAGAAACSSDDNAVVTTTPAYSTYYAYPVYDTTAALDYATWDYGYYDTFYLYLLAAQVTPGEGGVVEGGLPEGGLLDGSIPPAVRLPRPLGALLSGWGAKVRADCLPVVNIVDNDGDGIPASYDATFNCVNQQSSDRTTNVTGTVSVVDTDDTSPTAGLTITFTNFVVSVAQTNGVNRSRTLNGTSKLAPSTGNSFLATRNMTIAFDFSDPNQQSVQGTDTSQAVATYTPDADAGGDPFASGTVNVTGTDVLARNFQGTNTSRQITRSSNPALHWNRSCRTQDPNSSGYDAGTLIYQDSTGGSLRLTFSGCGAPTVSQQ